MGKRVMIGSLSDEPTQADELIAFLIKEGIPVSSLIRVEHSFNPDDFVKGKVDAMSAFSTNETDYLDRIGFPYDVYSPRAAGIFTRIATSRARRSWTASIPTMSDAMMRTDSSSRSSFPLTSTIVPVSSKAALRW